MKTFLCVLCSMMALTLSFTTSTFASSEEPLQAEQKITIAKPDVSKQATPNRFEKIAKRFYYITGIVVTAATLNAAYCGQGCQGIAEAMADAAPTMVGIYAVATILATIL